MKKTYKLLSLIICLSLLFGLASCGTKKSTTKTSLLSDDYPVTVGGVTLSAQPQKVIVLSDNIADIILALGYESVLKGRSSQCTQSELSVLPVVSIDDINSLKALSPDLIIVDKAPDNIQELALAGLPLMVLGPATNRTDFETLYGNVGSALMGSKTGYNAATGRAKDILNSIDDISRTLTSSSVVTTACYLYDLKGNAAAGDTFGGLLINSSGAQNAFENSGTGDISTATLKISNPDYIFCPSDVKASILSDSNYSSLKAITSNHVFSMDRSFMTRQGLSAIQAVNYIKGIIFDGKTESTSSDSSSTSSLPSSNSESSSTTSSSSSVSSSSTSSETHTFVEMKYGDTNEDVKALQQRLYELGYITTAPTGEFGDMTQQAITDFQFINGYNATGIINEATFNAIYSKDAIPRPKE